MTPNLQSCDDLRTTRGLPPLSGFPPIDDRIVPMTSSLPKGCDGPMPTLPFVLTKSFSDTGYRLPRVGTLEAERQVSGTAVSRRVSAHVLSCFAAAGGPGTWFCRD